MQTTAITRGEQPAEAVAPLPLFAAQVDPTWPVWNHAASIRLTRRARPTRRGYTRCAWEGRPPHGSRSRRWSDCVKPVAGTESCQARHIGVVHSGRLAIKHEDGTELELAPGEAYVIEPGHDAWVVGDERFVGFEFESRSAEEYAKG